MIPVEFNGKPAFLMDDAPDWRFGFSVEATIPASYERGLSGRETRRPTATTLRLTCKFSSVISSVAGIARLRNSLQALNVQPVLCAFYPAVFAAGVTPPVTADYYELFNADGSYNSIQPASALPFELAAAPLMAGILKNNPEPKLLAGFAAQVDWEFSDNGNYPLTPAAFEVADGLEAAGGVRPLFPFLPDWSTLPASGASEQDVDRREIGNLRTLATAYYAQRGRRQCKQFFTLQKEDPFNLLRFFLDMGGEQNNFWLGAALTDAHLAADLPADGESLTVDNGAALGTNALILLGDGRNRVPLAVSSVEGNVWNLVATPGRAFNAGMTTIESLVLARFDNLKLTLDFSAPVLATAQLQFKEVPWETNAVAGETYGTTMGALPPTASLFKFELATTTGTTTWYLTSFERDLTDGEITWLSRPLEFDTITETDNLERQSVTLKSRNFDDNPLALLIPFSLEFPLMVTIYEGDVDGNSVSNLRAYYYGEVATADVEPPFITADCESMSSIFDGNIPRRLYQNGCNWNLGETACGINLDNWKWTAVVVSWDAATFQLVIGTLASTNTAALTDHFFACGHVKVTTAGNDCQRLIGDSAAVAGGQVTLTLAQALAVAPNAGDVVTLWVGCDGQASTCINKFNNYVQFGGFPLMPVGNPSVLRIVNNSGGVGKK